VDLTELDRLGRTGLRARGLHVVADPVVAQRALPGPAVVLALLDHAVGARRNAVATAVADVRLHHDGAELGAEQRARRADVQAGRVGAVLAHVAGHQPADVTALLVTVGFLARLGERGHAQVHARRARLRLLDEGDVPPGAGAQATGVVVGHAGEVQAVLG